MTKLNKIFWQEQENETEFPDVRTAHFTANYVEEKRMYPVRDSHIDNWEAADSAKANHFTGRAPIIQAHSRLIAW